MFSFGCKKIESETTKTTNINDVSLSQTAIELINKLGGGRPKKTVKIIDAEIMNMNGKTSKLSDYNGKVIMLNLWATWCPPCREEMPSMQNLYNDFKNKNFTIVAVSQGENLNTVKKFLDKKNYTFPIFIDNKNEVAKSYNTGSIPTTYLINKNGNLIAQFIGGRNWYSKESIDLIKELVK
jgi:peroxiredoxin